MAAVVKVPQSTDVQARFELAVYTRDYDRIVTKTLELMDEAECNMDEVIHKAMSLIDWTRDLVAKFPLTGKPPARVTIKVELDVWGIFPEGVKELNIHLDREKKVGA